MAERVEGLLGHPDRQGDVDPDVPLGLRPDPAPGARAPRHALAASRSTTRATPSGSSRWSMKQHGRRPQAVPAAAGRRHDRPGQGRADRPGRVSRARPATSSSRRSPSVYAEYQRRLRSAGALDFDDIIMETVRLFREHPEVLEHYQERFRYVLIDEYQDTNRAQYHLVNLLAAKHRNLCVVGDADQGVYSWRGADDQEPPRLRARLSRRGGLRHGAELPLHRRRSWRWRTRSSSTTSSASRSRCGPSPSTASWSSGTAPTTSTTRRGSSPARSPGWSRRRASGTRDVAVFYRTNAQSRVLEDVFMRAGLAYKIVGGRPVLPAQGGQGRPRLPALRGEPRRPGEHPAGHQHAEAGDRRRHGRGPRGLRRATEDIPFAGGRPAGRRDRVARPRGPRARSRASSR